MTIEEAERLALTRLGDGLFEARKAAAERLRMAEFVQSDRTERREELREQIGRLTAVLSSGRLGRLVHPA
ncbi:MAG TPA: hypothetical protein VFD58_26325 [Blastocatellia bacterium]|nr:hypothetical protein [Blastocatellia bacterium]